MKLINLLPWRERERRRAYQRCMIHIGIAIGSAVALWGIMTVLGWHQLLTPTSSQYTAATLTEATTIEPLRQEPAYALVLLQTLPRLVTPTLQLQQLHLLQPRLTVTGVALNHQAVVTFLQALQSQAWIAQAQLDQLTHHDEQHQEPFAYTFTIQAILTTRAVAHDVSY